MEPLTGRQRRHLRALGCDLKATIHIGRGGLTEPVLRSIEEAYNTAELVKARLERSCALERGQASRRLAEATGSQLVQVLGRTILLYRVDPETPQIQLPP